MLDWSWFWALWPVLALGLGCMGAGVWLTGRRTRESWPVRVTFTLRCPACGESAEPDARFCGACGCSISGGLKRDK